MYGFEDRPGVPWWIWGIVALVYAAWCFIDYYIAREKHRDAGACAFAAAFLSPLLIWAYLVAVPPLPPAAEEAEEERPGYRRERL